MSLIRLYQAMALSLDQTVCLDEKASHHLARVLRARVGDELVVFNGQGDEYLVVIVQLHKKNVEVKLAERRQPLVEPPVNVCLAQGIARGEKMDFIIQKAVELGVTQIIPLITERSNVRLNQERQAGRLQHWRAVLQSACEQSGRHRPPEMTSPERFDTWLQAVTGDLCFVLSPHVNNRLPAQVLPAGAKVVLLIGPEGGLSQHEMAQAVMKGFMPLNLGPRVLRTETASLAALSILQYCYGDMGQINSMFRGR